MAAVCGACEANMWIEVILLGLGVGILVGLMGIGGGAVLVPSLVHLLKMDQHMAQGTSLFLQLPPIGLGALALYWRKGNVDLRAGLACALGFLLGGYVGAHVAVRIPSRELRASFGLFLMLCAVLMWSRNRPPRARRSDA